MPTVPSRRWRRRASPPSASTSNASGDANAATAHHVEEYADHAKVALVMDGLTRDVEFRLSDFVHPLDGAPHGLTHPYARKAGVCSTCTARVPGTGARMDRNLRSPKPRWRQGCVLLPGAPADRQRDDHAGRALSTRMAPRLPADHDLNRETIVRAATRLFSRSRVLARR